MNSLLWEGGGGVIHCWLEGITKRFLSVIINYPRSPLLIQRHHKKNWALGKPAIPYTKVNQHGCPDSALVITPNDQENLGSNPAQGNYSFKNVVKSCLHV